MNTTRISAGIAACALAVLALSGCGSSSQDQNAGADSATPSRASSQQADALTLTDPWIKAADKGMTAAFGTLGNSSSDPITITGASSSTTATMELHETVESDGTMVMRPKEGGFTVAASGQHELAPGGDHIMMMDLTRPVKPGELVTLTLTMADGSTKDVVFTVKNFTGAEEKYQHGDDMPMDMG